MDSTIFYAKEYGFQSVIGNDLSVDCSFESEV